MSGLPTITVLLDDASNIGTFPYDITQFVRLSAGINLTGGRGDEFSEVQPATLALTLENTDGRFTLGSTVGGYGAINIDRRIRYVRQVGANPAVTVFTGYVQQWPVEWPSGSDLFALTQVTAVDRMARLSRAQFRSVIEEEYLLDHPSWYYPLGEPEGSASSGDVSGAGRAPLVVSGAGVDVVFGDATGPGTDALTAASFTQGGKYLLAASPSLVNGFGEAFFSIAAAPSSTAYLWRRFRSDVPSDYRGVFVDTAGKLNWHTAATDFISSASVADGQVHHVAWYAHYNGGTSWTFAAFLDGVQVGTTTLNTLDNLWSSTNETRIGEFTGSLAHFGDGIAATSPATRYAAHAAAGLTGFAGERSDQRIARYAGYAGIASGDVVAEVGVQTVPKLDITGISPDAAMAKVVQGEGGDLFVRGDDKIVMQNREHRALIATPVATLTADQLDPDCRAIADMQLVANVATSSAANAGATQRATNESSRALHGDYPMDLSDLLVNTDEEAYQAAAWRVGVYGEPFQRMPDLKVDLLTLPAATQQAVAALTMSDRIRVTGLPSQAVVGGTQIDLLLEGWTDTLSADTWEWSANTSNFEAARAWVLDSSTYSVLDSTTRLSY